MPLSTLRIERRRLHYDDTGGEHSEDVEDDVDNQGDGDDELRRASEENFIEEASSSIAPLAEVLHKLMLECSHSLARADGCTSFGKTGSDTLLGRQLAS